MTILADEQFDALLEDLKTFARELVADDRELARDLLTARTGVLRYYRKRTTDRLVFLNAAALVRIEAKLDSVLSRQQQEATAMTRTEDAIAKLNADVAAQTTVIDGAKTLLAQLAAQIRANAADPAALEALATQIENNSATLSQAVVDNTPSA